MISDVLIKGMKGRTKQKTGSDEVSIRQHPSNTVLHGHRKGRPKNGHHTPQPIVPHSRDVGLTKPWEGGGGELGVKPHPFVRPFQKPKTPKTIQTPEPQSEEREEETENKKQRGDVERTNHEYSRSSRY